MTPAPSEPDQPDGAEVIADPTDRVGRIEESGVDYLPESQRDSNPRNVFAVFAGGNLAGRSPCSAGSRSNSDSTSGEL